MTRRKPIEYAETATGCHVCTSHRANLQGYAVVWLGGCYRLVHRVVYERHNGPIPDGLVVRHTCDNRLCINPAHLIIGSRRDNINDAIERDRLCSGERNTKAKLTADAVRLIRASSEHPKVLADRFGVHRVTISQVQSGVTWKRVK